MARPFRNVGELKREIVKLLRASIHGSPKIELIIRYLVYFRDELRCVYCKEDCANKSDTLSLDHIIPSSKGGGFQLNNLVTSCRHCNEKKANSLFSEKANALVATLIWQVNKRFLKHLDFEPEYIDLLEAVIASVEKKVRVFWHGELYDVISWSKGFTLRNTYTGEFLRVNPPDTQGQMPRKDDKKKRLSPYERLEKIMRTIGVGPEDLPS